MIRVKNFFIYEEVKDMTAEILIALMLLGTGLIAGFVCEAMDAGVFDRIVIKLNNYIVSRIERLEGKDI